MRHAQSEKPSMSNELTIPKQGLMSRIGSALSARKYKTENIDPGNGITWADSFTYDGSSSISALLGSGRRSARARQQIYQKWSFMEGDAIISSALTLHVTTALGGHETTGDTVFIEKTPAAEKDKKLGMIAEEINADLAPILNRIAHTSAYNAAAFGDSYGRMYTKKGIGVTDVYVDELVRPPIVQPFEQGNRTIGFMIYSGEKMLDRLTVAQMARLKMPRTVYVPQPSVVEKSFRMSLKEDNEEDLPLLPALVGGSFLYAAEESYDNLYASLLGMVGQRWMDSIDEAMVGVNTEGMTADQQKRYLESVVNMFKLSKKRAEEAVRSGQPVMERIRHIIPVFNEKQVVKMDSDLSAGGRKSTIQIDDVMLHAKLLSGALGIDLSMLGFADLLSGGLGDGGFFRTSAQVAEKSRLIRTGLAEYFYHIIDIHCYFRYGMVFEPKDRPYRINFYGSISAAESEKERTNTEAMGGAQLIIQILDQCKQAGMTKEMAMHFMTKQMNIDQEEAKLYAPLMDIKTDDDNSGAGGSGFGGGAASKFGGKHGAV